jgi:hypothetical protein
MFRCAEAQISKMITTAIISEYKVIPPPIRKNGQFLTTVAVAIDFI